ncbi:MAG: hypothetical protein ABW173_03105 [Sphingomonas sp.]
MNRIVRATLAFAAFGMAAGAAAAQSAAPATPAAYSAEATDIGTLIDNPQTKAILSKHLPDFVANPQIDMARSMTLKQVQSYAGDTMTDEVLLKIDADLAKVPKQN